MEMKELWQGEGEYPANVNSDLPQMRIHCFSCSFLDIVSPKK
jgi:hypothetical protein